MKFLLMFGILLIANPACAENEMIIPLDAKISEFKVYVDETIEASMRVDPREETVEKCPDGYNQLIVTIPGSDFPINFECAKFSMSVDAYDYMWVNISTSDKMEN